MKKTYSKSSRQGLPGGPNEMFQKVKGIIVSERGQWDFPGMNTLVPTQDGRITMRGVPYPVLGTDETGYTQMMYPEQEYQFPGQNVLELPMAQKGLTVSEIWEQKTGSPWSEAKNKGFTSGSYEDNINLRRKLLSENFDSSQTSQPKTLATNSSTNTGTNVISVNANSFNEAFNQARNQLGANKIFIWNGRKYGTNLKGEDFKPDTQTLIEAGLNNSQTRKRLQAENKKLQDPYLGKSTVKLEGDWKSSEELKREKTEYEKSSQAERIIKYKNSKRDTKNYVIVDKEKGLLHVYKPGQSKPLYTGSIDLGKNQGDYQTVTKVRDINKDSIITEADKVNNRWLIDWEKGSGTTGAGRYYISNITRNSKERGYTGYPSLNMMNELQYDRFKKTGKVDQVSTSFHKGYVVDDNNRVSNGCIRCNRTTLNNLVDQLSNYSEVYILPEDRDEQGNLINEFVYENGQLNFRTKDYEKYLTYIDSQGKEQEGQGINVTDRTLNYQPIILDFNETDLSNLSGGGGNPVTAKNFLEALSDNKQKIMKVAQINGDVYNEIAKMAFGILGAETNWGETFGLLENSVKGVSRSLSSKRGGPDYIFKANVGRTDDDDSVGLTQLKWKWTTKKEREVLKKFGITSSEDFLYPDKAAIGTAVILGIRYNEQLSKQDKANLWETLPGKWNNRPNYAERIKKNTAPVSLRQYTGDPKKGDALRKEQRDRRNMSLMMQTFKEDSAKTFVAESTRGLSPIRNINFEQVSFPKQQLGGALPKAQILGEFNPELFRPNPLTGRYNWEQPTVKPQLKDFYPSQKSVERATTNVATKPDPIKTARQINAVAAEERERNQGVIKRALIPPSRYFTGRYDPEATLQIPQSALVEGVEALRGKDASWEAVYYGDKQRVPADVWGFENKPGFGWDDVGNFAMNMIADPTNLVGVGFLKSPIKAAIRTTLDPTGLFELTGKGFNQGKKFLVRNTPRQLPGQPHNSLLFSTINRNTKHPQKLPIRDRIDLAYNLDRMMRTKGMEDVRQLNSPEGRRRLYNLFKETNPNLTEEELNALVFNRIEDVLNSIRRNPGSMSLKKLDEGDQKFFDDKSFSYFFPHNNAYYSPSQNYITLGEKYLNHTPTLHHEIGHAIQQGEVTALDDEFRNILSTNLHGNKKFSFKGLLDDFYRTLNSLEYSKGNIYDNNLLGQTDYFYRGSHNLEPLAFARELRQEMLENGILKSRWEEITAAKLKEAKKKAGNLEAGNRLLHIIPSWDYDKLAKSMNKLPALAPIMGVGAAGTYGANQLMNQEPKSYKRGGSLLKAQNGEELFPGEGMYYQIPEYTFDYKRRFSDLPKPRYTFALLDPQLIDENAQREYEQRLRAIDESVAVRKNPFSAERLARESAATGDKLSLQMNFGDPYNSPRAYEMLGALDYLNPAVFVGDLASGLGSIPYNIQEGNYGSAVLGLAAPLAAGALAGIGVKTPRGFINNLVNPVAGIEQSGIKFVRQNPLRNTPRQIPGSPNAVSGVDDVSRAVADTPQPWQMQELPGLHLKSTMTDGPISKIVEPKTGLINTEQALAIIGKESGGADKVALIRQALGDNIPKKMDYNEFRKVVQDQLIPLERQFATHSSGYGINRLGYNPESKKMIDSYNTSIESLKKTISDNEKILNSGKHEGFTANEIQDFINQEKLKLKQIQNNLENIVSTSPLENQTLILGNKSKFGRGSSAHGNPEETLGHAHFLRDAETPDVLTVTQIQSDAFQGTHRTSMRTKEQAKFSYDRQLEYYNKNKDKIEGIKKIDENTYQFPDGQKISKSVYENMFSGLDESLALSKADLENFTQKQLLDKNHQERYLQELVDYAASRGDINKMRLPTSETAAKVQGYSKIELTGDNTPGFAELQEKISIAVRQGNQKEVDELMKIHDKMLNTPYKKYSNEHQTILKKYSQQPKTIKKLFGKEPTIVTDSKGNTWYEFDIPEKFKQGKGEIKAYQSGGAYNMQRALELGYTPDETGHWPSVDSTNGMWLKSKQHPTAWMEYMQGYALNPENNRRFDVVPNIEGYFGDNQLQYVDKKTKGGRIKFQKGGRPTMYVDPNVPEEMERYKAYKDSLLTHAYWLKKNYELGKKFHSMLPEAVTYEDPYTSSYNPFSSTPLASSRNEAWDNYDEYEDETWDAKRKAPVKQGKFTRYAPHMQYLDYWVHHPVVYDVDNNPINRFTASQRVYSFPRPVQRVAIDSTKVNTPPPPPPPAPASSSRSNSSKSSSFKSSLKPLPKDTTTAPPDSTMVSNLYRQAITVPDSSKVGQIRSAFKRTVPKPTMIETKQGIRYIVNEAGKRKIYTEKEFYDEYGTTPKAAVKSNYLKGKNKKQRGGSLQTDPILDFVNKQRSRKFSKSKK